MPPPLNLALAVNELSGSEQDVRRPLPCIITNYNFCCHTTSQILCSSTPTMLVIMHNVSSLLASVVPWSIGKGRQSENWTPMLNGSHRQSVLKLPYIHEPLGVGKESSHGTKTTSQHTITSTLIRPGILSWLCHCTIVSWKRAHGRCTLH